MVEEFIGSYKVLRQIGAGGTAKVYLAVHQDVPNLKVILKILSDPRLGDRFLQEADKLAVLDGHPNICRIKHFFSHGDDTVIAMEYIDGTTLEDRVKQEGQLAVSEALAIICEVLDILDFAHRKKIYHRDIKPGNIMIDGRGQTKIIDFGIAKADTDPNLTAVGTACGTPTYMAPEQFNPDGDTSYGLVDVYAAGCTLYVMLTGRVPFTGDNPFAIRDAKLFEDPPSPREFNSLIPKELETIILKSIARDPADRYQTCREMINALKALPSSPVADPTAMLVTPTDGETHELVTPPAPPRGPAPKTKKNRTVLWIGIAATAVVVVAAIVYFMSGGFDSKPGGDIASAGMDAAGDTIPVTGTIAISVKPGGDIYIDDSLLVRNTGSIESEVDTGRHIIRVENSRAVRRTRSDTVWVADGFTTRRDYSFTIREEPKPPPKPVLGKVMVGSEPRGATIYIDGRKQPEQTIFTFELAPGQHTIRVEKDVDGTMRGADTTFAVEGDFTHRIKFDLKK